METIRSEVYKGCKRHKEGDIQADLQPFSTLFLGLEKCYCPREKLINNAADKADNNAITKILQLILAIHLLKETGNKPLSAVLHARYRTFG